MDITLHIGKRKYQQIAGSGVTISSITNPDPQLVTATVNSLDRTEYALDGVALGSTVLTILTKNVGNVAQQPIFLNVTILAAATVEVTSDTLSSSTEQNAGTAFPA